MKVAQVTESDDTTRTLGWVEFASWEEDWLVVACQYPEGGRFEYYWPAHQVKSWVTWEEKLHGEVSPS